MDANGQVLAYVYGIDDLRDARIAKALAHSEQHRQAARTATQAMSGCSFGRKLLGTSTSVRGLDSCDPKETVMGAVPSNEM